MPRECAVCGKGYSKTIKRSHSMRASIKRLAPNLQWTMYQGKRIKACTSCIKTATKKVARQIEKQAAKVKA